MESHDVVTLIIFGGIFLAATSLLQILSKRLEFPYTAALLLAGFVAQFVVKELTLALHFTLEPSIIFFFLLPILLFEGSMHITFHQFRLQFKTITFLATFGLLVSMFLVGIGITYLVGLPFGVSLLFGALISATDPIAVLALFKSLGAPKRLSLIADGESMFNDATAVVAFRIVAGFVLVNTYFEPMQILWGLGNFIYVFTASILLGFLLGTVASFLTGKVNSDRIITVTLTLTLALTSFVLAEHFLHLSGVMTTVAAGVAFGNIGKNKLIGQGIAFIDEAWGYLSFLAISLVFFFAAYNFDVSIFRMESLILVTVVCIVLIARAVSVYATFLLTNRLRLFSDEPNVPIAWQHIINWGGLRGVIPLVLVYTLPETFSYKQELIAYTMAAFFGTLFLNGITIRPLLTRLRLHVLPFEEKVAREELSLIQIEQARQKLQSLSTKEFDPSLIEKVDSELSSEELWHRELLLELVTAKDFKQGLKLQALEIEYQHLRELFTQGHIPEAVFHEFAGEIDLQHDAIEFPDLAHTRVLTAQGYVNAHRSYRKKLRVLQEWICHYPLLRKLANISEERLVQNRCILLNTRILTSRRVIEYLNETARFIKHRAYILDSIHEVKQTYQKHIQENQTMLDKIAEHYPDALKHYQSKFIYSYVQNGQPSLLTVPSSIN